MKPRRLADIAIGGRILFGFGVAAALMLFVIAYALVSLDRVAEGERDVVRILNARKAARSLDVDVLNIIVTLQEFVDTRDTVLIAELERLRQLADGLRAEIRRSSDRPVTLAALDRYEAILPRRRELADQLIRGVTSAAAGSPSAPALAEIIDERRRLDREARMLLQRMIDEQDAVAAAEQRKHQSASVAIRRNMLISGSLAIALMVVIALAMTRSITHPIARLHEMTERIGQGDFTARSDVASRDEIGDFARALNAMAADVGRLDRAKDEFLGLASHQLRTPATAVKNFIGLLREGYAGPLTPEQTSYVEHAWQSNEEQLAIIDAMLRVAHADAGRLLLRVRPTDLGSLVSRIIDQQRPQIEERRHTCVLDLAHEPIIVHADPEYLPMALGNLVSNASKYTQPGGRIVVTVTRSDHHASVAVSDTGVGIADEHRSRLYSKFSRIENPLSVEVGGSGIGLYLTKQIIELHGGTIDLKSRPGDGTTFTVLLPLHPDSDDGTSSRSRG